MIRVVSTGLACLIASAGLAAAQTAPASVLTRDEVQAALAAATSPDMMVARMRNTEAYRVNVVKRTTPQGAIAHDVGTEVHYVIEGRATLVTGGVIERAPQPAAAGAKPGPATIRGGQSRTVSTGDIVLVPVGTPHWYSHIEQPITYLEVRFDVKERER
jgi:mannose-6-phosphate isomerase-like protein (cupin superfamily)